MVKVPTLSSAFSDTILVGVMGSPYNLTRLEVWAPHLASLGMCGWSHSVFCAIWLESESVSHSVVSDSLQLHAVLSVGFSRQEYWSG